jgi:hypothetical protein
MRLLSLVLLAFAVVACDNQVVPSVARHPMQQTVTMDEGYVVGVVPQGGNIWVASGGMKGKEKNSDTWVEYRRKRGIEIASGCRIKRVLSRKGEPLLKASVTKCYK